jgi:CBS domain-containing protein
MSITGQLEKVKISDVFHRDVPLLAADAPLREAVRRMQDMAASSALVMDQGKLAGIFTERDLLKHLGGGQPDLEAPVGRFMTGAPHALKPEDPLLRALDLMVDHSYRNIPVLDKDGAPLGIVRMTDILRYIAESLPASVLNQPPVPQAMRATEGA